MRRHSLAAIVAIGVFTLFLLSAESAWALTLNVSPTGSVNPGDACPVPADLAVYNTIQKAVDCAAPNDAIVVAAGTYAEAVTVNKTLTLRGAQFGVNATTRPGTPATESVVDPPVAGPFGFRITANNVVMDGFTFQGTTNTSLDGAGVDMAPATSGAQVLNNIIQDNIVGIALANAPAGNQAVIRFNLIQNNNQTGPASGTGIYTDQFVAGGPLDNVLIDRNTFTNNQNVAVLFGALAAPTQSNVTVVDNRFTDSGNSILVFNTTTLSITGNTMTGSLGSQLVIGGGVSAATIRSNTITNGNARGIRIGDFGGGGTNTTTTINFNRIVSNAGAGLEIDAAAGSFTGILNAENNWWGCNAGPNQPGCSTVVDFGAQVDFNPWLVLGITAAPNSVNPSANSTITADLTKNSNGVDTSALGFIPNGTPITFATTLGVVNPPAVGTTNGKATTTFTAPAAPGTATVSATLDNQTVNTTITILGPGAPPAPPAAVAPGQADLSVTKTGPANVTHDQQIVYTIAVTNNGTAPAANVTVADPTPTGLTFVSNSGGCTTPFPCTLGTVPGGVTVVITSTFRVPSGYIGPNPIANVVTVGSSTTEPNTANNTATARTAVETPYVVPPEDDTDKPRKKTEEERQQAQLTNNSNKHDVHTEGTVISVEVAADGKSMLVTIKTIDPEPLVVLVYCPVDGCPTIRPGNEIAADGQQNGVGDGNSYFVASGGITVKR